MPELHNNLGLLLLGTGDRAGAEKEFRAAIRIQPGVAEWRVTLARLLASQGQTAEASYQLEQSLRSKPNYAEARIVYAHVLADMNRSVEAETQARLAVEGDRGSADAHELWGGLLAARGDLAGARSELRRPCACSLETRARRFNSGWCWRTSGTARVRFNICLMRRKRLIRVSGRRPRRRYARLADGRSRPSPVR